MTEYFTNPSHPDAAYIAKLNVLNTIGTISYVLLLLVAVAAVIPGGQWGPVLLIAALIIDLTTQNRAQGTWHATHFQWRIRSILAAALLYAITAPLWLFLIVPGRLAWLLISLWFLVRIVTGFIRMNQGQPMEISK